MIEARTCLVADIDDHLVRALDLAEDMLLTLAACEEDHDGRTRPFELPDPLSRRTALDAVRRVRTAVASARTRTDRAAPTRVHGPDGRHKQLSLLVLVVDQHDLDLIAATVAELHRVLTSRPVTGQHAELVDVLQAGADIAAARPSDAGIPVDALARAHELLDLADTHDTALLLCRLLVAAGDDVVLSPAEEAVYERVVDRATAVWV